MPPITGRAVVVSIAWEQSSVACTFVTGATAGSEAMTLARKFSKERPGEKHEVIMNELASANFHITRSIGTR